MIAIPLLAERKMPKRGGLNNGAYNLPTNRMVCGRRVKNCIAADLRIPCTSHLPQTMSATERDQSTCMPPELYIHMWKTSASKNSAPKFKSSVYPLDKPKQSGSKRIAKNKAHEYPTK